MPEEKNDEIAQFISELDVEFGKKSKRRALASYTTFPTYAEIEEPLLCLIFFRGGQAHEIHASQAYRPLADFFGLSVSDRHQVMNDGRLKWDNMVQWARKSLKDNGFLAPSAHGKWKLSNKGLMAAQGVQYKYALLRQEDQQQHLRLHNRLHRLQRPLQPLLNFG